MKKFILATWLIALAFTSVACSAAVNQLTGGDSLKPTAQLWSDVPKMDGLAPSQMELPLFAKVLMKTALNQIAGDAKDTGDWIVFSTAKLPEDVKNFYTNERMASNGWEPSENSTCLSGSAQGLGSGGIFCVFEKHQADKQIGLMIIAAPDDQTKQTEVFFVRVEELATPVASKPTTATQSQPTRGAITMLNGPAPYGIEKRPMPTGLDLDQLLPKQVGAYTRESVELSTQQGVQAKTVEKDGNSIYAHYKAGAAEIFLEFAVSNSAADAQATLDVAAGEVTGQFPTDPRFGSMGTEPSYLKVNNESGAFFAWTRGGYYFSASAKNGESTLDAFMQAFPY